ncbi:soluble calcium-activated nucleotidase 1 isoform X1 [Schistocerca serialis cubense]|uniref:soluble calcium-activated nucleotidase 1 isoform X1 n=1 Tax=Schistocerca serialis cubense TaxID=2023355 RepID=UPI00214E2064|nr:soluble calcium-activated nucleotidase 1 isoform X1 [Schistocerca serialis cubense]
MPVASESSEMMTLRDWRQAIRTPTAYRVGNSTLRIQTHFVSLIVVGVLILLLVLYTYSPSSRHKLRNIVLTQDHASVDYNIKNLYLPPIKQEFYNFSYPLTPSMTTPKGVMFRIGIISDMDKSSKQANEENAWRSCLKKGYLTWNAKTEKILVTWDDVEPLTLKSNLGESGRGMELSELVTFNAKILAFDDRTGVVYEIDNDKVIPWVVLPDGDGRTSKGFKMEWATVKDQTLYIGGLGKEWTTSSGELVNFNPQWIKTVSVSGEVSHINWRDKYNKIRRAVGIEFPGYMIHEAVSWSTYHKRWFFLPRRSSKEKYDENLDNERGTNMIITADENFDDIKVTFVGEVVPTHGFSSFKFLPGTDDSIIVALKTMETSKEDSESCPHLPQYFMGRGTPNGAAQPASNAEGGDRRITC